MVITFILALLGFINAYYLHYQYKQYINSGKKIFCLIGGKCADVVSSKYGATLGIKNELIGMTYYVLLAVYILISMVIPEIGRNFMLMVEVVTIIATTFSIYLLFVQTVILRMLCSWCLIAIAINFLIFYFLTSSLNSVISF